MAYKGMGGQEITPREIRAAQGIFTVATLPTAVSGVTGGARTIVTDSVNSAFWGIVSSGGSATIPVFDDGAGNWRIG